MKLKIKILITILVFLCASMGYSLPRKLNNNGNPFQFSPKTLVIQRIQLNPNNCSSWFQNTGIFNQDTRTANTPGFEWPKGKNTFACFTSGLTISCFIGTASGPKLAQVAASYKGEWAPGYVPTPPPGEAGLATGFFGPDFHLYSIKSGDNANNNSDYATWYKMVPYGAPYTDVNHNGQYDDGVDIPGQPSAGQTIFECVTDCMLSERVPSEGFGGGVSAPYLRAELHWTSWAYTTPGLEDLQFINFVIINKGDSAWRRTYMSIIVDPDLGYPNDDYIGCDTTINLGYDYNANNNDPVYGLQPPAFGMDYFKSPVVRSTGDTLGLTSFGYFSNPSTSPPICEQDPNPDSKGAYYYQTGHKRDSTCFLDPTQPLTPPFYKKTKFLWPGDPESQIGWTENKGAIQNCGGDSSGTIVAPNPPGDRRFIFNSGSEIFDMNPGDTQNIVLAQFAQRGSNNLNSVTRLKSLAKTARLIYNSNFNVTPPPPPPVVNYTFTPTALGQCDITLSWGDISESFNYLDTIFFHASVNNRYYFQGYEIYEINKYANSIPDFTKPETIDPTMVQLIDIFDKNDSIGVVIDTFATYSGQYAAFPIVPPYKMTTPNGFPNKGINRSITLTGTQFSANYGNVSNFIYGQEYDFAVVAYAVSANKPDSLHTDSLTLKRGFRVIANSVGSQLIKIRPITPPAGTVYTMRNGDTLNLSFPFKDLGLAPIIRNQDLIINGKYRIEFNPDTSYNIMRMPANQSFYDTLTKGLKWVNKKSSADDSSRTIDGIYFNLQKLRYTFNGSPGGYDGNVGVLHDPSSTVTADSIQTRVPGWEYIPAQNRFLAGTDSLKIANGVKPFWQSTAMNLLYPTKIAYNNIGSKVQPSALRSVKIKYTGYGNGQMAYRYLSNTNDTTMDPSFAPYVVRRATSTNTLIYQDRREVPFKVFINDPNDTANGRQVNCAFVEANRPKPFGSIDGKFEPNSHYSGGSELLYIFNSNYNDATWDPIYTDTNYTSPSGLLGLWFTSRYDVMYIWGPKRLNDQTNFTVGDEFHIYPYTFQRPYLYSGSTNPFFYEFTTVAPNFGDLNTAKNMNAMNAIKVVPNPYYGFSTLDRGSVDKFVTFRNLPLECTIKIYTLNGDLIKTIIKTKTSNVSSSSTAEWNLQNQDNVPVASGIYVALIDAPGIGQKILKIVVFVSQERLNF